MRQGRGGGRLPAAGRSPLLQELRRQLGDHRPGRRQGHVADGLRGRDQVHQVRPMLGPEQELALGLSNKRHPKVSKPYMIEKRETQRGEEGEEPATSLVGSDPLASIWPGPPGPIGVLLTSPGRRGGTRRVNRQCQWNAGAVGSSSCLTTTTRDALRKRWRRWRTNSFRARPVATMNGSGEGVSSCQPSTRPPRTTRVPGTPSLLLELRAHSYAQLRGPSGPSCGCPRGSRPRKRATRRSR